MRPGSHRVVVPRSAEETELATRSMPSNPKTRVPRPGSTGYPTQTRDPTRFEPNNPKFSISTPEVCDITHFAPNPENCNIYNPIKLFTILVLILLHFWSLGYQNWQKQSPNLILSSYYKFSPWTYKYQVIASLVPGLYTFQT